MKASRSAGMQNSDTAAELRNIFGTAVRLKRQSLGLSQREMALRHGLSQRLWCAVERGSNNITLRTMARLAAAVDSEVPLLLSRSA
jgi:transcriptional regulator with XRE-family HTH domain